MLPLYFLPGFRSIGLLVQETKGKGNFQGNSHLGFSIGRILATFDQQVAEILFTKFQSNWHLNSGDEAQNRHSRQLCKIDFQDCGLGVLSGTPLAIFNLHVIQILPTKFRVNWPFSSGEVQNRFFKMASMAIAILDFQT